MKRLNFFAILCILLSNANNLSASNNKAIKKQLRLSFITKILRQNRNTIHNRINQNLKTYHKNSSEPYYRKISQDLPRLIKSLSEKPLPSRSKFTKLSLLLRLSEYDEFHFLLLKYNLVSQLLPYLENKNKKLRNLSFKILKKIDPQECLVNLGMKPERTPEIETSSYTLFKPKKALIILAGKEKGGTKAFHFKNFKVLKQALVKQGYKVKMKKATTTEQVLTLITERKAKSYDLLMLGGHGCPVGIDFGDDILSLMTPLKGEHFNLLKDHGKIFLISCSTGKILTSAITGQKLLALGENICEYISEVSGKEVVAPIFPTNFHTVFVEQGCSMAFDGASSLVSIPCSSFLNGEFLGYEEKLDHNDINQFSRLYHLRDYSSKSIPDVFSLLSPGPYQDLETGLTVLYRILANKENNPRVIDTLILENIGSSYLFDIFSNGSSKIRIQCLKIFRLMTRHSEQLKSFLTKGLSITSLMNHLTPENHDYLIQALPLIYSLSLSPSLKIEFLNQGILKRLSEIYFNNDDKEVLEKLLLVINQLYDEKNGNYEFPVKTNLLKTRGWLVFTIRTRTNRIKDRYKNDKKLHKRLGTFIRKWTPTH